jgi:disulfide bond formation protein DsbB
VSTSQLTDVVSAVLAALAVLLQVLVVALGLLALAALVAPGARRALAGVRDSLGGAGLWLAAAVALAATLGSLFYSEVADFVPCRLCWYQRIAMYPLAVVLPIAAFRRDRRGAALYALPLTAIGALIAAYHIYIEVNPDAEPASCRASVPCSVKWIEELGYVTIPVLSITAFAAVAALLSLALSRGGARVALRR